MVQRMGGLRRKTRQLMRKGTRTKGKISMKRFFAKFVIGDKVQLLAEPAYQGGMYFPRYYGKVATVQSQRGECYLVHIMDRSVKKELIVHPVHLRKVAL